MEYRSKEAKKRRHAKWASKYPEKLIKARKNYWQRYKSIYRHRRYTNIAKVKDEFGGRCQLCGYNKNYACLVFHHKDADIKESEIAKLYAYQSIKKEAQKCILLCHNCHMDIHNPERRINVDQHN